MAKKKNKRKIKKRPIPEPKESRFSKLYQGFQKRRLILVYCVGFISLVIFLSWLTEQDFFDRWRSPLLEFYATISSFLLNLFGQDTSASGESISSSLFSIQIKKGCDAIAPMILYTVGIAVFPFFTWMKKWKGIAYGLLAMFLMNIVRILSLYFIGRYANSFLILPMSIFGRSYTLYSLWRSGCIG